ncbi:hypothetical protein V3C99_007419 [Haemonchus contortus]|nr:unnamed protein product [Haemonchus contortus]
MAVVFSEDDRNLFSKFTSARNANHISDDMMEDVHNVLSNKEFSHATRLAAAKLLVHFSNANHGKCTRRPSVDWVILTAMLEMANPDRLTEIVRAWMVCFRKRRIGDSEDEAMFLAALARILPKKGLCLKESLSEKELNMLHRFIIFTFILLSELDRGSKIFDGAVLFVVKTMPLISELFDFCVEKLDPNLRGKYGIMKIFLREMIPTQRDEVIKSDEFIKTICDQLNSILACQLITNSASGLVATLVSLSPTSAPLQALFAKNLVHHTKCIRSNILRWFGRFEVTKESCQFLLALQRSIRESFLTSEDDVWPPRVWETEDVSCIDPRWETEESEDVLWEADRLLDAYLNVTSILQQRYRHELDAKDPLIYAGLKWHLPEIRLSAFRLWRGCLGEEVVETETNRFLEKFILNNGASSLTSLRQAVKDASSYCTMTPEGEVKWEELSRAVHEREKLDDEQRGTSYLPDELSGTEKMPLPSPQRASERLEEALQLSGSASSKSCPTFPELYENLAKAGCDQRVFARFIIELINLVKSHNDVKTALDVISEAVIRCRLKVVVDHGCNVVDEILSTQHYDEHFFFLVEYRYCWAMNHLIDQKTECRTLPLSRILWSVCEKSRDLLQICFESCRTTLSEPSLDTKVLQRVLKTLKLFASKADCKMPKDFVEFLFWHCVDVQKHNDFLVRSAATILFGFVVRYITRSRVVPAFYIVATRVKFWQEMVRRCSTLPALPSCQRTLLLSFLSRFTLGCIDCYSASVLQDIRSLLQSLIELLEHSPDIRERRFCLEILVNMSPREAHEELKESMKHLQQCRDQVSSADCDFLAYILKVIGEPFDVMGKRVVPVDLLQSKYVQLIERCRNVDPGEALNETEKVLACVESHSAELVLQAVGMALTQIAVQVRVMGDVDPSIRCLLVSQCRALLENKWCTSRVMSILSRVPVNLGLTRLYYQKFYVLQVLRQWECQKID